MERLEQPTLSVPLIWAENGQALRVAGTRIPIDTIVTEYQNGATAEEIVGAFDTLRLSDVYAVIAYYLANRASIEAYLSERAAQAEVVRRHLESLPANAQLREKLAARKRMRSAA